MENNNVNSVNVDDTKCNLCNITSASLKRCSRCRVAQYCSDECQKMAWTNHKMECCTPGGSIDKTMQEKCKIRSTFLRKVKKQQGGDGDGASPIVCVSMTAFGLVAPGLPIPPGVPPNFALKQQATVNFMEGPSRTGTTLGNLRYETSYRDYYNDLVENESLWMTFFQHQDNSEHAENTCGILGTLATIYRRRGGHDSLQSCEDVLDMWTRVFNICKSHCDRNVPIQAASVDAIEFKTDMVRYNLMYQTQRYEECVAIYPRLFLYEFNYNVSFEDQSYLFMIPAILKKTPSKATIRSLTHDEIMRIVLAPTLDNNNNNNNITQTTTEGAAAADAEKKKKKDNIHAKLTLQTCACCKLKATTMDQFKKCPRCTTTGTGTFYCGKDCQKKDWKAHKKICCK